MAEPKPEPKRVVIENKCPKCGETKDIYELMVELGKDAGIVGKDYAQPNERRIVRALITQERLRLVAAGGGSAQVPIMSEEYCTCAKCGCYYLKKAEVFMGPLNINPQPVMHRGLM
jgi:predicted nucleic-acid-binding Zn-ribbon protein